MVECQLPKLKVASSSLVARSTSLSNSETQFSMVRKTLEASPQVLCAQLPAEMKLATNLKPVSVLLTFLRIARPAMKTGRGLNQRAASLHIYSRPLDH
jgi:hypothetical protein